MKLIDAARKLRNAQKAYMANRGNVELGKAVALAAKDVDEALANIDSGRVEYREEWKNGEAGTAVGAESNQKKAD